jgi:hypothetical protein
MDKEHLFILMVKNILENGKMIKKMVKGNIYVLMEINMKDNGKII